MIDDKIEWFVDPKKFTGFMQEPNGERNCFDLYGLYKGSRDVWVRVGYLSRRNSVLRDIGFMQLFSAMYLVVCLYVVGYLWF